MTDPMRDLFCTSVEGNSGPTLPDPAARQLFIGDAFLLLLPDGSKELYAWSGKEWVAVANAPRVVIEEDR